jgi:hypothetical protein
MIRHLRHDRDDSTFTPIRPITSARRVNAPQLFNAHPAAVGRQVCWGFRQSIPSSEGVQKYP